MNESKPHQNKPSLEVKIARELSHLLEEVGIGSALKIAPNADFLLMLERYIPQQLLQHYPEWQYESLDGFVFSRAQKVEAETAEFVGQCILISDQTMTPVLIRLSINSADHSKMVYEIQVGEPGGGSLGISGPPWNSSRAYKLLEKIESRLDTICWSYMAIGKMP